MAAFISRAVTEDSGAVDWASDGEAGLDLAKTYDYDAIVLDLMLPKLDGLAVCRALRAAGKRTPVLIVSARDMVADRVQRSRRRRRRLPDEAVRDRRTAGAAARARSAGTTTRPRRCASAICSSTPPRAPRGAARARSR